MQQQLKNIFSLVQQVYHKKLEANVGLVLNLDLKAQSQQKKPITTMAQKALRESAKPTKTMWAYQGHGTMAGAHGNRSSYYGLWDLVGGL